MLKFLKSSSNENDWLKNDKDEICFIGRSNVGKSSLINALFQSKEVRVSKTPGRTQLINYFEDENKNIIVDLPGYGYAKLSKKQQKDISEMIYEYLTKRTNIKKLFMLIDSRHGILSIDLEFYKWIKKQSYPTIIIATKKDKLNQSQLHKITLELKKIENEFFIISSLEKHSLKNLKAKYFKLKNHQI